MLLVLRMKYKCRTTQSWVCLHWGFVHLGCALACAHLGLIVCTCGSLWVLRNRAGSAAEGYVLSAISALFSDMKGAWSPSFLVLASVGLLSRTGSPTFCWRLRLCRRYRNSKASGESREVKVCTAGWWDLLWIAMHSRKIWGFQWGTAFLFQIEVSFRLI